jgi:hypothetical protein
MQQQHVVLFSGRHGLALDFSGSDGWKHDGYMHGSVLLYL